MPADVGTGFTATFGTTSYAAEIVSADFDGAEVAVLDTAHMGTTGARTKRFGDLKEEGSVRIRIHFNPNQQPPLGTAETVTFTFPIPSALTNGATAAGQGGISAWSASIPLEDLMSAEFTVTWTDDVTWTDAS